MPGFKPWLYHFLVGWVWKFPFTRFLIIVSTSSCQWGSSMNDELLHGTQTLNRVGRGQHVGLLRGLRSQSGRQRSMFRQREKLNYHWVSSKVSANPQGAPKLVERLRVIQSWGRGLDFYTLRWISCWIWAAPGKAVCFRQSGFLQPRATPWEGLTMDLSAGNAQQREEELSPSLWDGEPDKTTHLPQSTHWR